MTSHFPLAADLGRQLFDPRGRCNRQGFLALALALLALQALVGVVLFAAQVPVKSTLGLLLNAPLFWIGAMATLKRLHDTGRSGWWVPAALFGWMGAAMVISVAASMILGPEAMLYATEHRTLPFWIIFMVITLPAFGGLLWLHAASGDARANRFGDMPGIHGFSAAAKRDGAVLTDDMVVG